MAIDLKNLQRNVIRPALALLPASLDTPEARVMLLAIGLQESRFASRYQRLPGGGKGPARGFWQFERGSPATRSGVTGVALHPSSAALMRAVCQARDCPPQPAVVWLRLETDDVLAASLARLLLFTHPQALPALGDVEAAWDCYAEVWRPGKPRRETWEGLYAQAVAALPTAVRQA